MEPDRAALQTPQTGSRQRIPGWVLGQGLCLFCEVPAEGRGGGFASFAFKWGARRRGGCGGLRVVRLLFLGTREYHACYS